MSALATVPQVAPAVLLEPIHALRGLGCARNSVLGLRSMKDAHKHLENPALARLSPMAKLLWLYIADAGEDEYSARDLEKQLGVSYLAAHKNLTALVEAKLLLEVIPAAGSRGATLRAVAPKASEGER